MCDVKGLFNTLLSRSRQHHPTTTMKRGCRGLKILNANYFQVAIYIVNTRER